MDQCFRRVACHGVLFLFVAFWQVVVLLLFCLFLRPVISFPFCCVLEANTKVDRCFLHCFRSLFRALGHGVLWFCFLVALRFECMLASLFVCCICSSCHGVSFFLLLLYVGTNKRWISVSGVLRAILFCFCLYIFGWWLCSRLFLLFFRLFFCCFLGHKKGGSVWSFVRASGHVHVGILGFSLHFLVLLGFFLVWLSFWGKKHRWISVSGTVFGAAFGLQALVFSVLFFSQATFECTLAFMVVLGIFSSCQDVSLFLVFFFGSTKRWISVSGNVFGASLGLQAMVFCGSVFFSRATFRVHDGVFGCSHLFVLTFRFLFVCCLFEGANTYGS